MSGERISAHAHERERELYTLILTSGKVIRYLHIDISLVFDVWFNIEWLLLQGFVAHLPLQFHASTNEFVPAEIYSLHACVNAIVGKFVASILRKSVKLHLLKSTRS